MRLATALEAFIVRRGGALHTLLLAGSGPHRLRAELPPLLELVSVAMGAAGGPRMRLLDVSGHLAGDGLLDAALPLLRASHAPRGAEGGDRRALRSIIMFYPTIQRM